MITTIQVLLKKYTRTSLVIQEDGEQALRLATAALLVEVACADGEITDEERVTAQRVVESYHALSPEQARELVDEAESRADDVTSLYPFTRLITSECSLEDTSTSTRNTW